MGPSLRGGIALAVIGFVWFQAAPGLGYISESAYLAQRDELAQTVGPWLDPLVQIELTGRRTASGWLRIFERPFRIAHRYHLYGNGPRQVDRLEIRVDGELWYRSVDDAHAWHAEQLGFHKLRQVAKSATKQAGGKVFPAFCDWLVAEVLEDEPDARVIELVSTRAPFPDVQPAQVQLRTVLEAPDFEPRVQRIDP